MNSKGAAILADPHPCGHIVYPYTDEVHVAEAVCLFASAGLHKGEGVVLVMAADHGKPIRRRLEQEGFNLRQLEKSGQLICEEAENLLSTFMFDWTIDELVFKTKVGKLIERAKVSGGRSRPVRVFGEMVDLIWKSNPRTTQRLEELWNEIIGVYSVPLLCAYSLAGTKPIELPGALMACHSHAIA
jgi:MEDS: MEthanogen/methylotroph, DcmR Sensory domain